MCWGGGSLLLEVLSLEGVQRHLKPSGLLPPLLHQINCPPPQLSSWKERTMLHLAACTGPEGTWISLNPLLRGWLAAGKHPEKGPAAVSALPKVKVVATLVPAWLGVSCNLNFLHQEGLGSRGLTASDSDEIFLPSQRLLTVRRSEDQLALAALCPQDALLLESANPGQSRHHLSSSVHSKSQASSLAAGATPPKLLP